MKEPLRIFVENYPIPNPWYVEWIPITIAIMALAVSIGSLIWSVKQYKRSSRPFVWAMNFATLDNHRQIVINRPETVMISISNSPAKLQKTHYIFYYKTSNKQISVHSYEDSLKVMFPHQQSQYTYTVPDFGKIVSELPAGIKFERDIRIEYSSLSSVDDYFFQSHALFDSAENVWRVDSELAT